jgi:hypothetical protein
VLDLPYLPDEMRDLLVPVPGSGSAGPSSDVLTLIACAGSLRGLVVMLRAIGRSLVLCVRRRRARLLRVTPR